MKKLLALTLALLMMLACFASCAPKTPDEIRVYTLNGTTGFGMAKMIADHKDDATMKFEVKTDAADVTAALIAGTVDIAALPINAAANVYNKTEGGVKILAVNTLGCLYLLTKEGTTVSTFADLAGKKYHSKRNHIKRFYDAFPDAHVEPISDSNRERAINMVRDWYKARLEADPNGDYFMEQAAIEKAFRDYDALDLYGLILIGGDEVLALTMGSKLSHDTVDVHFEKARPDVQGAYAAINNEFAKYIRDTLPEVKFLDREEDMGLEGLRKAKRSYYPHHMVEKCWACLLEDGYDY